MDNFWHIEIIVSLLIQSWGTWLAPMMNFFSFLGEEYFYILILPALYWCFDAGLAVRLTFLLVASASSNSLLKITFHGARPYWINSSVKPFAVETSFGLPSGHAQNAASLWGYLSIIAANKWLKTACIALIFLIGFSRLYLGVHFASDVLIGWLLGGIILFLFIRFEKPFLFWFAPHSLGWKTAFMTIISLLWLALGIVWFSIQSQIPISQNWIIQNNSLPPSTAAGSYSINDFVTFIAVFWGMMVGYLWLSTRIKYNPASGSIRQKLGRFFLGLIGVILIAYGIAAFFPSGSDFIGQVSRLVRYTLASLWISAFAPVVFKKCSLI